MKPQWTKVQGFRSYVSRLAPGLVIGVENEDGCGWNVIVFGCRVLGRELTLRDAQAKAERIACERMIEALNKWGTIA